MLIDCFDKLASGRPVSRIAFAAGELVAPQSGMRVGFANDDEQADVWICHDETGVWLASNAHQSDASGYRGFHGFEEPLSAVRQVVFVDSST
jgi:hypothetical protein